MKKIYNIFSLKDMEKCAINIAKQTNIGNVITLSGTLGAGKTCFANYFINYFLKLNNKLNVDVTSPTFNIVKEYEINNFSIYHFDLYRLKNSKELFELDIENCFENGISLIEWPEIAENILYNVACKINIKIIHEFERTVEIDFLDNFKK